MASVATSHVNLHEKVKKALASFPLPNSYISVISGCSFCTGNTKALHLCACCGPDADWKPAYADFDYRPVETTASL